LVTDRAAFHPPGSKQAVAMPKERVCIVGSGNWGSAIARIVGANCARLADYETTVNMWVFEEQVDGKPLTEIINETHVNVKYLPDAKLPENIVAVPDLAVAAKGATMLIFVLPHQFLGRLGPQILGAGIDPNCRALSLIKGIEFEDQKPKLISSMISAALNGMACSVLMGANVANEVAKDEFCEATIGCHKEEDKAAWKKVFHTPVFQINTVNDVPGVELCGALKNVVAIGAGFCDGLKFGGNTKAAIIRIGLSEMMKFCNLYFKVEQQTFFESCGVADLMTTCYGGRNRKCAEAFAAKELEAGAPFAQAEKEGVWAALEKDMLNGQKLQGTLTSKDVMTCLRETQRQAEFPLFVTVYEIAFGAKAVGDLVKLD